MNFLCMGTLVSQGGMVAIMDGSASLPAGFIERMAALGISYPPEVWAAHWDSAVAACEDERQLYFLTDVYIQEANAYFRLNDGAMSAVREASALIRDSEELAALTWLWKYLIYGDHRHPQAYNAADWPTPEAAMGDVAGLFRLIVAVSNLPWLIEHYRQSHIPQAVLLDTLSDIGIVMEESRARRGVWGVEPYLLGWLSNHFRGKLFRLGRLQYMPIASDRRLTVYRHAGSGQVLAFVDGMPVSPSGQALPRPGEWPQAGWEPVLQPGDWLLDVHIPRGGRLDYAQLTDSYRRATEAFPNWFPDRHFHGFICDTWMLDPQLRELMSAASNLLRFQDDYYLFQISEDDSIFENVFVTKPEDLRALPEATSLQRAVKKHVLSGKRMQSAAGFLLFDDLGRNPAYYREKQGVIHLT